MSEVQVNEILEMNESVEEVLATNVEFTIDTELLKNLISKVERSVSKTSVNDIEKGIYLYVDRDSFILRGTNSDFGTEVKIAKQELLKTKTKVHYNFEIINGEPGGAVVIQKNFKAMINKLPRKVTTIKIEKNQIFIQSGTAKFHLHALDHNEYIQFPVIDEAAPKLSIHPEQLLAMYNKTSYAASPRDEAAPILTGICHEIAEKKFSLLATDRHQMAYQTTSLDDDTTIDDVRIAIPTKSIEEVKKQLKESKTVTLYFFDSQTIFEFDQCMLYTRNLVGIYPNPMRMVPTQFTTEVHYRTKDLYDLIDRALLLHEDVMTGASFKAKPSLKQTRILATEQGTGDYTEDIACLEGIGADIHIGLNIRYVFEALKVVSQNGTVKVKFVANDKPLIIQESSEDEKNFALVLPVRLKSYDEEVAIPNFTVPMQIEADFDEDELVEDEVEIEEKEGVPIHKDQTSLDDLD